MKKSFVFRVLIAGFLLAAPALLPSVASADVTITPTRVLFEDRDRFAEVTLVNTSDKRKTYEISWLYFKMQESGVVYEPIEVSLTEFDLAEHIVYTPRRVTLPPSGKQKVRLALRRPAEVPAGEYRAHLRFAGVPDPVETDPDEQRARPSASVKVNVGYSIPVIFQSGKSDAGAVIQGLTLERNSYNGRLTAMIPVVRTGGPYGALGHLYVYYGDEVVGEISNAHIFPEVNGRTFEVQLLRDDLSGGNLRVVYKYYDPQNEFIYDEKSFPIQ